MKKSFLLSLCMAMGLVGIAAFADDNATSSNDTATSQHSGIDSKKSGSSDQAGTAGSDQSGQTAQSSGSDASSQQAQSDQSQSQGKISDQAKQALAPHSIFIHSELQAALDDVKGMKAQIKNAKGASSPEVMQHLKTESKELSDNLKMAFQHEKLLSDSGRRYPMVSQSDEYKSLTPAFSSLAQANSSWQSKRSRSSYWNNQQQVMSDLDNLQKQLSSAIDKTESFNKKINVSTDIG